jgi:site-specific recombinase XerD
MYDNGGYHTYKGQVPTRLYSQAIPATAVSAKGRQSKQERRSAAIGEPPSVFIPRPAFREFFVRFFVGIRNEHTFRAYLRGVRSFASWCEANAVTSVEDVEPQHVGDFLEWRELSSSKATTKQDLSALRSLMDAWVLVGLLAFNPAKAVRGPTISVRRGKTRVLNPEQVRELLNGIDISTMIGLRDRALILLMAYTFARVGATVGMTVLDYFKEDNKPMIRLQEKGSKEHIVPAHPELVAALDAYLRRAGIRAVDPKRSPPLFQSFEGTSTNLSGRPLSQPDVYRMVRRRALAVGIVGKIGCHSWRATGITTFLRNGGQLDRAQRIANHSSIRTTQLYDRRADDEMLDDIEQIKF